MKDLISSKEAAEKLGLSLRRVQALITAGRLPAQKIGNSYVVQEKKIVCKLSLNTYAFK
jgi:excisionase family DNA binding protein